MTTTAQDCLTAPVDAATTVRHPVLPSASVHNTDADARREIIDAAKQILMSAHGMTEPQAYRWIQKSAMDSRSPMKVVAGSIIETCGSPVTAIAS